MFKSVVTGRIKYEPEYKIINNKLCCNFTVETKTKAMNKKSLVRCCCWNEDAKMMQEKATKGSFIIGMGDSSIVSYGMCNPHVFNLNIKNIEIIS